MTSCGNSIDTPEPDPPPADGHESNDTLRYHLLGPSLTKAGQDAVDQQKVRGLSDKLCILFRVCECSYLLARSLKSYTRRPRDQNSSTMKRSVTRF